MVYPSSEDGTAGRFYPKGLQFFLLRRSVSLDAHQPFCACTNCGHVWSYLNPAELRSLLARGSKQGVERPLSGESEGPSD